MKSVEDIIQAAHQHGFGHLAAEVAKSARRTLLLQPSEGSIEVGTSKFGGCPDLPEGISWPESGSIKKEIASSYEQYQYEPGPMRFIAQINFSELPFVPDGLVLPSSGLLYFFAAVQKVDFPLTGCSCEDWCVFSSKIHDKLVKAIPPVPTRDFIEASQYADLSVDEDRGIMLPEFKMEFYEDWIPDRKIFYGQKLGSRPFMAYFSRRPEHRLGGYPNYIQNPIEPIAGHYSKYYRQAQSSNANDFTMLAQFDSDDAIGLIWTFGARGFFVGDVTEFKFGNFNKLVLITQCS